jgi:hypothetical protein
VFDAAQNQDNQAVTLTNVPTVCPLVLTVGFGADACAALTASSASLSLLVLLGAWVTGVTSCAGRTAWVAVTAALLEETGLITMTFPIQLISSWQ